jgi:hypothetical protein
VKVYVLVLPWCAASLSYSHGCPNKSKRHQNQHNHDKSQLKSVCVRSE